MSLSAPAPSASFAIDILAPRWWRTDFPFGALIINVTGSLLIGLLVGWLASAANENWSQPLRLFIASGAPGASLFFGFSACGRRRS